MYSEQDYLKHRQRFGWLVELMVVMALGFLAGCDSKQSASEKALPDPIQVATNPPPVPPKLLLSLHWAGKTNIIGHTNAIALTAIWNLPDSLKLEEQTLDRLASSLPILLGGAPDTTNSLTPLLRPLLVDLLQFEGYSELWQRPDQTRQILLAAHLPAERGTSWSNSLPTLISGLKGGGTNASQAAFDYTLTKNGDWTLLGLGTKESAAIAALGKRAQTGPTTTQSLWLELNAELAGLIPTNSNITAADLPALHLALSGEGANLHTRAELTFPHALNLNLEPWNIPTNVIHDPLVSFTAMRGLKSVLEQLPQWQALGLGAAPNQVYTWGLDGAPFLSFFAAPWSGDTNQFGKWCDLTISHVGPYLATNSWGQILNATNEPGVIWSGIPFFQPFLTVESGISSNFMVGGWFKLPRHGRSIPPELLAQFITQSNLVAYGWELTSAHAPISLYLAQAMRLVCGRQQLPPDSLGTHWLSAVAEHLGNTTTAVTSLDTNELQLIRVSTLGFTSLELQVLADWLESPVFPIGFHTTEAPKMPRIEGRRRDLPPFMDPNTLLKGSKP